ncbi:flagellar hook capping FlgD N-terminal domain-containing protein [Thiosulfatihalobacter marinus]|uniref:flagellar hook capping FlgD N-terminal domain-containing protein n=1 Tax=Thiosulfatihalobacter marinus TaxID=2792481 RepID=UPI0018D8D6BB|nr:flagellar hook capping FlgD N-terminal domain-containing protein [Thiosulfatihalobacter marinus]
MTISAIGTTPSATSGQPSATNTQGATAISSDFETFLQMLSVQMRNQDPLNPVDSSEYAVQLATFSSVEQQVFTNDLLTLISAQMGSLGMSGLASWVGMEARVTAPAAFSGEPIDVVPRVESLADAAFVRVLDETGNEVQRFAIDPSDQALRWTGAGDDGQPLPDGNYSFEVESWSNGKVLATYPADVYTRITEARGGSNGMMLIAAGGVEFLSSQVISLREPS